MLGVDCRWMGIGGVYMCSSADSTNISLLSCRYRFCRFIRYSLIIDYGQKLARGVSSVICFRLIVARPIFPDFGSTAIPEKAWC